MPNKLSRFIANTLYGVLAAVASLVLMFTITPITALLAALSSALCVARGLSIVALASFLIPNAWRSAAFVAAPMATTILPGTIAAVSAVYYNDPNDYDFGVQPPAHGDAFANMNATAAASSALILASKSAQYTPMLAAAINAPVSLAWFTATSAVAGASIVAAAVAKRVFLAAID